MHEYFPISVHFAIKKVNYFVTLTSSTVKIRVENDLILPVSRAPYPNSCGMQISHLLPIGIMRSASVQSLMT